MNKYKEALNSIRYANDMRYLVKETDLQCIEELVDRATPKKPIIKQSINGSFDWEKEEIINYHVCPNGCKQVRDEYVDKFCSECGQAIDWSENE